MKKIILTVCVCLLIFTSIIYPVNIFSADTTLPYHTKIAKATERLQMFAVMLLLMKHMPL
jgi:hypothetical protein